MASYFYIHQNTIMTQPPFSPVEPQEPSSTRDLGSLGRTSAARGTWRCQFQTCFWWSSNGFSGGSWMLFWRILRWTVLDDFEFSMISAGDWIWILILDRWDQLDIWDQPCSFSQMYVHTHTQSKLEFWELTMPDTEESDDSICWDVTLGV